MQIKNNATLMEMLTKPADFDVCIQEDKSSAVYLAMDVGSTTQRIINFGLDMEEPQDLVLLSTAYASISVEKTIAACASASQSIIDNLELIIKCNNPTQSTRIKSAHVVKGSLLKRINMTEKVLTADASKVDDEGTYINILANTSIMLLARAIQCGIQIPEIRKATIDLTVSLPPDDANLIERVNRFKDRLVGNYSVEFVRLGKTVNFEFKNGLILTGSEPLGAAIAKIMEDDFDQDQTCAFINCGGRSSGAILYVDGLLKEGSSFSFAVGGFNMLNILADKIAELHHTSRPRYEILTKVLETGVYREGAKKDSAIQAIAAAKDEMADAIYNGLSQALSHNQVSATEIANVYCSGRTFGVTADKGVCTEEGVQDVTILSDSICANLMHRFAEKSPETLFSYDNDQANVARGMLFIRLRKAAE